MVAAVEAILESKANGMLGPGAAALTRLGGGTGFRGDEMAYGAGSAPPPLNINGADRYQFVTSNPVGRVDSAGTHRLKDKAFNGVFWGWLALKWGVPLVGIN